MPLPALALIGIGEGLKLGSNLLTARSARRRRDAIIQRQIEALRPAEDRLAQGMLGSSESQGSLLQAITTRTLMSLAGRGVLQGSGAAGEVAGAIAPVEQQRTEHLDEMAFRLAAVKQSIYGGSDAPGMADAWASSLGSAGNTLAYLGGRKLGAGTKGNGFSAAPMEGIDANLRDLDPDAYNPEDELASAQIGRANRRRSGVIPRG
jgi:hypothetical protein